MALAGLGSRAGLGPGLDSTSPHNRSKTDNHTAGFDVSFSTELFIIFIVLEAVVVKSTIVYLFIKVLTRGRL
jgi:hypothetical protein